MKNKIRSPSYCKDTLDHLWNIEIYFSFRSFGSEATTPPAV